MLRSALCKSCASFAGLLAIFLVDVSCNRLLLKFTGLQLARCVFYRSCNGGLNDAASNFEDVALALYYSVFVSSVLTGVAIWRVVLTRRLN